MDKKLKAAIAKGQTEHQETQARIAREEKEKRDREHAAFEKAVQEAKSRLKKSGELFTKVTEAVAKGEKSFNFYDGSYALCEAINQTPGFHASYDSGSDTDEGFTTNWSNITVTWDDK